MSPDAPGEGIRRILLALDPSPHGYAALDLVTHLAALLGAELHGLYVQDEILSALDRSPLLREVDALSGRVRPMPEADVVGQLQEEAARAGRELARVADEMGVAWWLRVSRGRVAREVVQAAGRCDLVTLGVRSRSPVSGPGSTVRALVAESERPVMIVRQGMRIGPRVHVLDDGTEAAERAVAVGEELTRYPEAFLVIDVAGAPDSAEQRMEAHARRAREAGRDDVSVRPEPAHGVGTADPGDGECGLLILPRSCLAREGRSLDRLVRDAGCPVLVVG